MEIHATSCLGESTVLGLIEGRLGAGEASSVEAHLASCRECRELVSELARSSAGVSSTLPATEAAATYSAGLVLGGRFRLTRPLGEGGMGTVWAAQHLVTRKEVALKIARGLVTERERHRFLREARVASALDHPGIVPVRDAFELDDGTPVLVMDLLLGRSLREHLREHAPLCTDETEGLLLPLLDALGAAHAHGVVHRDLKPENIFLVDDGDRRVLKVLDFGVAKLVTADEVTGQTTRSGEILGTPFYMAPEQAFGEKIDRRVDLWAVGVILYECLTGVRPFHGENLGQLLKAVTTGDHQPIAEARPQVPRRVAAVIEALLSVDRDRRLATTDAVRVALLAAPPAPDRRARAAWWIGFSVTAIGGLAAAWAWRAAHRPPVEIVAPQLQVASPTLNELPAPLPTSVVATPVPTPAPSSAPAAHPDHKGHRPGDRAPVRPAEAGHDRLPGGVVGEAPY